VGRQVRQATAIGLVVIVGIVGRVGWAQGPAVSRPPATESDATPLDSMQWAVVNSLTHPERTTPAELLDAAIRAAKVEALAATLDFLDRFDRALAAEADPEETLAELGETIAAHQLRQLERYLKTAAPLDRATAVSTLVSGMQQAAWQQRTDPARLRQAGNTLGSDDPEQRQQAADILLRGGTAALPVLVELLMQPAPEGDDPQQAIQFVQRRRLTRQIIGRLGTPGTEALIGWLGSADFDHFPGVIAALDVLVDRGSLPTETSPDAATSLTVADVLLGPALIPEFAAAIRTAARSLLDKLAERNLAPPDCAEENLTPATGCQLLAAKLDRLLTPAGIPETDSLFEGNTAGGLPEPTVEQYLWVAQTSRPEIRYLPPTAARGLRAGHLARDLSGLGCTDEAAVRLVLLAQAETLILFADEPASAVAAVPREVLAETLAGPSGYDSRLAAEVLDEAVTREMPPAAAVVARTLREHVGTAPLTLIRPSLVRATSMASDLVQFEATRTLGTVMATESFPGSSQLLDRLAYFASSTGVDRAVIAHPNRNVAQTLATGLSRFGYDAALVSSGRDCLQAVRESPDTTLVLLSSRLGDLAARETIQLLRQQALGSRLPVLVVLEPRDDIRSGRHRTQLMLSLADFKHVLLTDRLESQFLPHQASLAHQAGSDAGSDRIIVPRFLETIARVAGPKAADAGSRRQQAALRLERAAVAFNLLASLGDRGWPIEQSQTVAQVGLRRADTFASSLDLLAVTASPTAQQAIYDLALQAELPVSIREAATTALGQSIARHGILLTTADLQNAFSLYNAASSADDKMISRALVDLLEAPSRLTLAADAQEPR
jgi:CheY-like chemotaxis protein